MPQKRKTTLPPNRPVLVNLPLQMIDTLDAAADILNLSRSDVIRRSLNRDMKVLVDEVSRHARRVHPLN